MSVQILQGIETASNQVRRTQVYQATHDGADIRLPLMRRSFISFTFGGKNIEDFGLIAITENNSMDRALYADFNDLVSTSDVLDGSFYWNTHYRNNTLDLILCTDEITEKQLTSFAQWFKPGFSRELILAEHPNRGIMARIAAPPQYHLLPFEKQIIAKPYNIRTSTTMYRGKINLSFVMEEPFWYSLVNILNSSVEGHKDHWYNFSTKKYEAISTSKDALKIIEEDGIPTSLSLKGELLIGNNISVILNNAPARVRRASDPNNPPPPETCIGAYIGGRSTITTSEVGFESWANNEFKYFYYAGTAPCAPILKFTINFSTDGQNVSNTIGNTFTSSSSPYSSIFIESVTAARELRFTTPSLITAYNQAIVLGASASNEDKRDKINHYKVRAAAINGGLDSLFNDITQADFTINCATGETNVIYHLKDGDLTEKAGDMIRSNYLKIEDRNYPDENGYIHIWTEDNPENSHKMWHNIPSGLSNVSLIYRYMYL